MQREPVIIAFVAQYLVSMLAQYGFDLEPGLLTNLISAGTAVVAALLARSRVTPVAKE